MLDYIKYRKSISAELLAIKDRIRFFIDYSHLGEDGRYKEIILSKLLRKHIPSYATVGTGFVVSNGKISTQIDIIVYNNLIPPLFLEGEFVIVSQESVFAIIEVKTNLSNLDWNEVFQKAHQNGQLFENKIIFNGIFSFESKTSKEENLKRRFSVLQKHWGNINYISYDKDIFVKFWEHEPIIETNKEFYRCYHIDDLSFGYFIANLCEDIQIQYSNHGINDNQKEALYCINKEAHSVFEIKKEQ